MSRDLLKQLRFGTSQAAKLSTRLVQTDASKQVLEQQLVEWEREVKALLFNVSDLSVIAEGTVR